MRRLVFPAVIGLLGALDAPSFAQQAPPEGEPAGERPRGPAFELTSPDLVDGAAMPDSLKCTRDGGSGLSPHLAWTNAPRDTGGYAIVMQHYPHGTYPGVNDPSHYWLVWNIPADAQGLAEDNPDSLGVEGSDKDIRSTGYTPPCSPAGGAPHEYTIWVYALDGALADLPAQDSIKIDWSDLMAALDGHVLNAATLTFTN
jgi:Raf kinase inhibitor-like YbhB/YbcL family protein